MDNHHDIDVSAITLFFDECLNDGVLKDFNTLVSMIGTDGVMKIVEKIDYKRSDDLIDLAIKNSFNQVQITSVQPEYLFGCRHPTSETYSWDNAFVVSKLEDSDEITIALFKKGVDYVAHPPKYEKALDIYNQYLELGWIPMSKDDLENTSGMMIGKKTEIKPVQTKTCPIIVRFGIVSGLVAIGFFFIKRLFK